jgi:hypothetical protein
MKTISKPVRATEETFKSLKILAATMGLTMGQLLKFLSDYYKEANKGENQDYTPNT